MKENNNKIHLFIQSFLNILKKESIQYCILRAIEKKWQDSSDIDICINKDSVKNAISILESMIENENAAIIFNKYNNICRHHLFIAFINRDCIPKILKFDFQTDFYAKEIFFLNSKDILETVDKKGSVFRPSIQMEIVIILIHAILEKGYFKKIYWSFILENYSKNKNEIRNILQSIFNLDIASKITDYLDNNNKVSILSLKDKLIRIKNKRFFLSSDSLKFLFNKIRRRIYWLIYPVGKYLNIKGPDNKRNLNIAVNLSRILNNNPYKVKYIKFNNSNIFINLIKYLFIYLFKIRPILSKNGTVILLGFNSIINPLFKKIILMPSYDIHILQKSEEIGINIESRCKNKLLLFSNQSDQEITSSILDRIYEH